MKIRIKKEHQEKIVNVLESSLSKLIQKRQELFDNFLEKEGKDKKSFHNQLADLYVKMEDLELTLQDILSSVGE